MTGFGSRDREHGCEGVHDDIYVRALYLTHENGGILTDALAQLRDRGTG